MEIPPHRVWMYNRHDSQTGRLSFEFIHGVEEFIAKAETLPLFETSGQIRCPCKRCNLKGRLMEPDDVRMHLYRNGFVPNYYYWRFHGEHDIEPIRHAPSVKNIGSSSQPPNKKGLGRYDDMVFDAFVATDNNEEDNATQEEQPNEEGQRFYDRLNKYNEPLWDGCEHTALSLSARMLSLESDGNVPQRIMDGFFEVCGELGPRGNDVPKNYYEAKNIMSMLGLVNKKIDYCVNGCMLYYKNDSDAKTCKFCGTDRYKHLANERGKRKAREVLVKRLHASSVSAPHMRWHHENRREDEIQQKFGETTSAISDMQTIVKQQREILQRMMSKRYRPQNNDDDDDDDDDVDDDDDDDVDDDDDDDDNGDRPM